MKRIIILYAGMPDWAKSYNDFPVSSRIRNRGAYKRISLTHPHAFINKQDIPTLSNGLQHRLLRMALSVAGKVFPL